jgi:TatD DNase family protein
MSLIDTHCHIYCEEFDADREKLISEAKASGISALLLPNIDDESIERTIDTCERYPDFAYPMMGLHPTSVDASYVDRLRKVEDALSRTDIKYIAIGEIGMDLYWDKTYLKEQKEVFEKQLRWSVERNLPVALHVRDAFDEVLDSIYNVGEENLKGVFHSFTGTSEQLSEVLRLRNFLIGVNGVVTFKNSNLGEVLKNVGVERLLLETDAPYLSPVPYRGKRNEPTFIWKTAEKLSEIYGLTVEAVVDATAANAKALFGIGKTITEV